MTDVPMSNPPESPSNPPSPALNPSPPVQETEHLPALDKSPTGAGCGVSRTGRWHRGRAKRFLVALQESFSVLAACRRSGLPTSTAYDWRRRYPDFAAMWTKAEGNALDRLAGVLYKDAVEGEDEAIVSRGEVVGHQKRRDHRLGEFLLERRDPRYKRQPDQAPADRPPPIIFRFIGVKLGDQRTQTAKDISTEVEVLPGQSGTNPAPAALPAASNDEKPQENRTNEP